MTTALAVVPSQQPNALAAYEPRNMNEAFQLAQYFAASRLLANLTTPEQVLLIMATGAELNIPPTTALRAIHIIKGKPVVSADLKVSLCLRRRDRCEYFALIESTEEQATYETKPVGGQPVRMSFSIADAKRAKLPFDADSNWSKYPRVMLRHRASAELAQAVYPDLVLGLYSPEQLDDEDQQRGPVVLDAEVVETPKKPEPKKAAAPTGEHLNDKIARLINAIAEAKTNDELTVIAADIKAANLPKVDRDGLAQQYAVAQRRVKAAAEARAASAPAPSNACSACEVVDGHAAGCPNAPDEIQGRERQAGEEG